MFATALLAGGCAISGPITHARDDFDAGRPDAALERLADEDGVAERDRLVALLEGGMIAHVAGRIDESIVYLRRAANLVDELDATFVGEQSLTLVTNDRLARYRGEYAERLWIRTVQMMNHLLLGDVAGAAVEARQAIAQYERYGEPLDGDVVTRVLAARTLEAVGERDGAAIEYARAFERGGGSTAGTAAFALDNAERTGRRTEARSYRAALERAPDGAGVGASGSASGGASLLLAVSDGLIPRKRAGNLFIRPDLRISFPYYATGGPPAPDVRVTIDGRAVPAADVSTRLGSVAETSLGARAKSVAAKQALRVVAKQGLGQAAAREDQVLGALVDAVLFLLEEADTRGWGTLPATLSLVEVKLAPGRHDVAVTLGGYGAPRRIELGGLDVRAETPAFVALRDGPRGLERIVPRAPRAEPGTGLPDGSPDGPPGGAVADVSGEPAYSSSSR